MVSCTIDFYTWTMALKTLDFYIFESYIPKNPLLASIETIFVCIAPKVTLINLQFSMFEFNNEKSELII